MKTVLLPMLLCLAACDTAPDPTPAQRAAETCRQGGIPPGTPGYENCFSRTMSAMIQAQGQNDAARRGAIIQHMLRRQP